MTEKNRDYAFSRKEYKNRELDRKDLLTNPIEQFETWLKEALQSNEPEPTAMALATVSERGEPSARTVLLKEIDEEGFVFYTNYDSRKGKEIEGNPRGALVFFWPGMERQVRVEGLINKTSERKSDAYFSSRPGNSRRGAWASPQSQAVSNRRYLEGLFAGVAKEKLKERPPFWGGYLLVPSKVEFWQGRPNRLNDRFLYKKVDDGWEITRLAP